jgi:ABC-type multidrug transport system fused ATPase/permease subunit
MRGIAETAIGIATGGALLVGAWLVEYGGMSVGSLAAAVGVIGLLTVPARHLERVFEYFLAARVAHEKVEALLALPRVAGDGAAARPKSATISIRRARIVPDAERMTARISLGKKAALSGPFGGAMLAAIAGLSEPDAGRVRIGRVAATTIHPKRRSRLVTLFSPDVPLLKGTIRRNVAYANPRASEDDIARALELAGVAGEIKELPDGLDARVGEGGANLTSSLRLRIGLARALLGEPPIVLIDQMGLGGDVHFKETLRQLLAQYPGTIVIATDDPDLTAAAGLRLTTARSAAADAPSAEIIPFRAS